MITWKGHVLYVTERGFIAELESPFACNVEEVAFSFTEIPEGDRRRVVEGAAFEWSLPENGTATFTFGGRWSKPELSLAQEHAKEMAKLFEV